MREKGVQEHDRAVLLAGLPERASIFGKPPNHPLMAIACRLRAAGGRGGRMTDSSRFSILDAIHEPRVFESAFRDLTTWQSCLAFLSAPNALDAEVAL
jgi:hypothetical protein